MVNTMRSRRGLLVCVFGKAVQSSQCEAQDHLHIYRNLHFGPFTSTHITCGTDYRPDRRGKISEEIVSLSRWQTRQNLSNRTRVDWRLSTLERLDSRVGRAHRRRDRRTLARDARWHNNRDSAIAPNRHQRCQLQQTPPTNHAAQLSPFQYRMAAE